MTALQSSVFVWLALIGFLVFLAVLPTLIAIGRGVDDIGYIVLVNVICCATVFGWPIALIAAIMWPRRYPRPSRRPPHPPPPPSLDRFRSRLQERGPNA
ncbi:superinfection immunity protein [Actinomadura sp. 7K507]|uniref:superinfection immunity protein n=1 Tax=Actinomadura sp. 7K507 TaxID=2530365 RepID=UPI00104A08B0|nr:superinfection immunity protein [Actinomadura sp. 7K507]TDC91974.1 superinfection immunity protein [Actinomadura sp. 7K507]